ncbi:MAG: hypothetical protein DRP50_08675 [Thermotoga sp.]|nr:MAG: hypothetical protein DRP50_08675 [Thermotoga sp.]
MPFAIESLEMIDMRMNTRQMIIDAAVKLFSEKGYNRVSVNDIAHEARVQKTMIYYYFSGKEDLFLAAWNNALKALEKTIFSNKEENTPHKISGVIEAYIEFAQQRKASFELLHGDRISIQSLKDKIRAQVNSGKEDFMNKLRMIVEEAQEKHEIRDDVPPKTLTAYFVDILSSILMRWLIPQGTSKVEKSFIKKIVEHGISNK